MMSNLTMSDVTWIIAVLFIHFVADFPFQKEEWARNKSTSFTALLYHTMTYSIVWWMFGAFYVLHDSLTNIQDTRENTICLLLFVMITFVSHTITDYFTSKITSKLYKEQKFGSNIPNFGFFTVIGLDQVLHYIQLFFTLYLLQL